jgi:hypothetical protein
MSYNGGVSYKGSKSLAQQAMPEALKLFNMVSGMKAGAGLDRLEKVYDLEGGGTVRIVDFEHVQHIYIDVSDVEVEEVEEVEEEEEEVPSQHFAVFPVHKDEWSALDAVSGKAVSVSPPKDIENPALPFVINEQQFLIDTYLFESTLNQRTVWSRSMFIGPRGIYLHTDTKTQSNRYAMGWAERAQGSGQIKHRGNSTGAGAFVNDKNVCGFGIMGNKLIYALIDMEDFTGEALPTAASGTVTVESVDITFDAEGDGFTVVGGTKNVIGTFSQARTDYGLAEDAGFEVPNYQVSQAGFWYDLPYNPETSYHPLAGSLFFNFSPDGTKAVRCRYFPVLDDTGFGGGQNEKATHEITHKTWKEELAFELDVFGDVQMTRTKTANPDGATYTCSQPTLTDVDNTTTCPPAQTLQPNGTSCSATVDRVVTKNHSFTISAVPLPLAYDYDTAGDLVTLAIKFTEGTGTDVLSQVYTGGSDSDYSDGAPRYTKVTTGTYNKVSTTTKTVAITSELQYTQGGSTQVIPYYHASFNETYSNPENYSYSTSTYYITGSFPESGTDYALYTGSTSITRTGTSSDNYLVSFVGHGISDLDLRHGVFVISDSTYSCTWAGSGENIYTGVGAPGGVTETGSSTYSGIREDTLWVLKDGTTEETPLTPVVGDPLVSYAFSEDRAQPSFIWSSRFPALPKDFFSIIIGCSGRATYNSSKVYAGLSFPIKSSCWAQGLIRGAGGSLSINYVEGEPLNMMFSVQGMDFDYARGNTQNWTDFVFGSPGSENRAQLSKFPICGQAVYYYEGKALVAATVTDILWAAEEYLFNPFYLQGDVGVGVEDTEQHPYGLANTIEFTDSGENI